MLVKILTRNMPLQHHVWYIILIMSVLTNEGKALPVKDKNAWANQVYARLVHAMGDPSDAPQLLILSKKSVSQTGTLAYLPGIGSAKPGQILVQSGVLSLCRQFGPQADDALACLLGHELAHFQYRHGNKKGFFAPLVTTGSSASGSSKNLEAVADRAGVFIAYMAGYEAFTVAPRIYAALYATFHLPDRQPGYPDRSQRLTMVADTATRVRELAQFMEVSEVYYLLHDYTGASKAATALVSRLPDATTLNNLGVIKLNQAMEQMPAASTTPRLRYLLPIEYNADNRLLASHRRDETQPYQLLLTDALLLFQTALSNSPTNETARLNQAIALYLLEQTQEATKVLASLQTPNALLMHAILAAETNQPVARRLFRQAVQRGAFRALANSQLFEAAQQAGWQTILKKWTSQRQRPESARRPTPPPPTQLQTETLGVKVVQLPGGIRYQRTDSLTIYWLPVLANGKTQWRRILKSANLALPGLPTGSLRNRLTAFCPPVATVAGARNTQFYEYTTPAGGFSSNTATANSWDGYTP